MDSYLSEIQSYSVLNVSGEDCANFLHGQITVNTKAWQDDFAKLAAHCDFKGKMWNIAWVLKVDGAFQLIAHNEGNEQSMLQFKKYGVFSKVAMSQDDNCRVLAAYGEKAEATLTQVFPHLPKLHGELVHSGPNSLICINQSERRYIACLEAATLANLKASNADLFKAESAFEWHEISDGIANIKSGLVNEFVPQMFNLQALGAIDFNKGCYMGQEVVARTKFLGKNKRAVYLLQASNASSEIAVGDAIERQLGENFRRVGHVIRSVNVDNTLRVLAVLPNDIGEQDMLRLKDDDLRFEIISLPYSLNE